MATQYWAQGVWTGKWHHEQREAWMRQIEEVQMWRRVRGPAGAMMCETSDLCVGHAIVQGDEAPVGEVAQGVQVHGVPVRHGEKQEKEEGEVEQEVKGQEEENAQTTMRMSMDEMKVTRHVRGPWANVKV